MDFSKDVMESRKHGECGHMTSRPHELTWQVMESVTNVVLTSRDFLSLRPCGGDWFMPTTRCRSMAGEVHSNNHSA